MSRKKPSTKQNMYTLMFLKLLKELTKRKKARLSIREIGRILKINPMAVSRSIKRLEPILDIKRGSDFESFRLSLMLIRLKDSVKHLSMDELIGKVKLSRRMLKEIYKS
jgi:DNA-binding IclR family transcriptional regulator